MLPDILEMYCFNLQCKELLEEVSELFIALQDLYLHMQVTVDQK